MNLVNKYLEEASSANSVYRYNELLVVLQEKDSMGHLDGLNKLKGASMKTQKAAAKIFQQAISLIKGL